MQAPNRFILFQNFLTLLGMVMIGLFLFGMLGMGITLLFTGFDLELLQNLESAPEAIPNGRIALLVIQGVTSLGGFVITPYFFNKFFLLNEAWGIRINKPDLKQVRLVLALSFFVLPVMAWLVVWNKSWVFPGFLAEFESWSKVKEEELARLTEYLVNFQGMGEFLVGFVVISIIAGWSEEYFFRGILQPRLISLFQNPHISIWLTGFIFSAIHMQFYGLVPRMMLGVLFGYYYFWSKNLFFPILGHILNNGITVFFMYLNQAKITDIDMESTSQIPWFTALGSALAVGVLVFQFKLSASQKLEAATQTNPMD